MRETAKLRLARQSQPKIRANFSAMKTRNGEHNLGPILRDYLENIKKYIQLSQHIFLVYASLLTAWVMALALVILIGEI
jgi:hypothetical protein